MLKRQRSSPNFFADAPYAAPSEPAVDIDILERVTKRRRQFPPPQSGEHTRSSPWGTNDDGEEDVIENPGHPRQEHPHPPGSSAPGVYAAANSLLHDLHAEQRHRSIFASAALPASHPILPHARHFAADDPRPPPPPSCADKLHPTFTALAEPALPEPPLAKFRVTIPSQDPLQVEEQCVIQRYEETNRYLGSLFLSRRRNNDGPGP